MHYVIYNLDIDQC